VLTLTTLPRNAGKVLRATGITVDFLHYVDTQRLLQNAWNSEGSGLALTDETAPYRPVPAIQSGLSPNDEILVRKIGSSGAAGQTLATK